MEFHPGQDWLTVIFGPPTAVSARPFASAIHWSGHPYRYNPPAQEHVVGRPAWDRVRRTGAGRWLKTKVHAVSSPKWIAHTDTGDGQALTTVRQLPCSVGSSFNGGDYTRAVLI
jgi:hypothetical protein